MNKRKVEDTEVRKIQDVPKGEYVRVKHRLAGGDGFTKRVYKLVGFDRSQRQWMLDDCSDICLPWLGVKTDTLVQVGFTY